MGFVSVVFCEGGFMEKLDEKWIINPKPNPNDSSRKCKEEEKIPTTLGLDNMRDSFILIAAGEKLAFPKVHPLNTSKANPLIFLPLPLPRFYRQMPRIKPCLVLAERNLRISNGSHLSHFRERMCAQVSRSLTRTEI